MPGDNVVISMLGDMNGNGAAGSPSSAKTFEVKGRWENGGETPDFNYDFWYQPRKSVLISSEFGEPKSYEPGFDLEDVKAGHYGSRLHFWNLAERNLEQTLDLGETGLVPLEVRWLHDPDAEEGFVGAALSSTMWRFRSEQRELGRRSGDRRRGRRPRGQPPVPGLITDLVLSMDDRFLYFLELAARRFAPVRRLRPGGQEADRAALARRPARQAERRRPRAERRATDAPALVRRPTALRQQLLYSTWDNQFYPGLSSPGCCRGGLRSGRRMESAATSSSTCTTGRVGGSNCRPDSRASCGGGDLPVSPRSSPD